MKQTNLIAWLSKTIGINYLASDEIKTNCPECSHANFYFNLDKKIGFCHRASCHYSPTLPDLEEKFGKFGTIVFQKSLKIKEISSIIIPGALILSQPQQEGSKLYTFNLPAYLYLVNRGVSAVTIMSAEIRATMERVYIPVYDEKYNLLSYVSRSIKPEVKGYLYPKGGRHAETFMQWENYRTKPELTLVENTFVSLWLKDYFSCTTNFGSHLSAKQVDKILHSSIRRVAILWDEGAEKSAEKACKKLRQNGVAASYCIMKGQPDDYDLETVKDLSKQTLKAAKLRGLWVDPFKRYK